MLSNRCTSLLSRLNVYNQINSQRLLSSLSSLVKHNLPSTCQLSHIGNQNLKFNQYDKYRHFSTEPSSPDNQSEKAPGSDEVPLLMDFIPRGMPSFWYSVKNFYIINFILRAQIDKSFEFTNFIEGAKHALTVVSSHLANNRLDNLTGMVDKKALEEIKQNYKLLNMAQRKELELIRSDIVLSFAHHVHIETLKEEFTGTRKHIVYLFIVFDCIRNLEEILKEKAAQRGNARDLFKEFNQKKIICNYEFKREYIEGGETSDWIITKLLHIRESDYVNFNFLKR